MTRKFRCLVHSLEPSMDENSVATFYVSVNGVAYIGKCGEEAILPESHIDVLDNSKRYAVVKLSLIEESESNAGEEKIEVINSEDNKKTDELISKKISFIKAKEAQK